MENIRKYDDIVKHLEKNRNYHKFFLELLENIQINRKKDGTHFANKNQTFVNANYTGNIDNTIKFPELKLVGRDKNGIWQEYSIYCYIFADELPKDDERRNKSLTGGYTRDCYNLTTDEIIEKIEQEKETQKRYIEQYNKQIEESGKIFDLVSEKLEELKTALFESTKDLKEVNSRGEAVFKSSLEYAMIDYIKNNL